MEEFHSPVLLREVKEALNIKVGEWYLDATLGDGGHSLEILKNGGKIIGIDVDPQALDRAKKRFETAGIDKDKWKLSVGNFRDINNLISKQTETKFAGVLFDLGVSSLQLMDPGRGFSFSKMGLLDMRMDPTLQVRALDLVNGLNKGELYELFSKLGEEKYSKSLAEAIISARALKPFKTTKQLSELVEKVIARREKIHPATRVFQALRIAVNDELNALKEGLNQVKGLLGSDGRVVVISFHSLEDRIVKNTFREWQENGIGEVVTKKPVTPSKEEIMSNPRSRSAKMRVFKVN